MSEPAAEPTPSRIQQRMALNRRLSWTTYQIVVSLFFAVGWAAYFVLDGPDLLRAIGFALFLAGVVMGVLQRRAVRRDIRTFEGQHGPDAGIQKPIT